MERIVYIEKKAIPMKSNGLTARLYARYFQKDLICDFFELKKLGKEQADTQVIENIAWVLAKTANNDLPDIEEWLSQFEEPFSVFRASKQFIGLLDKSFATSQNPKKKKNQTK